MTLVGKSLLVASALQELGQVDVSGVVKSGVEIVDILAETYWGLTMYVTTETKVYEINAEHSGSVSSSSVLFGE